MIQKIKTALGIKTNQELAERISAYGIRIDKSRISHWKKNGFHGESTKQLILLLLSEIEKPKC